MGKSRQDEIKASEKWKIRTDRTKEQIENANKVQEPVGDEKDKKKWPVKTPAYKGGGNFR